MRRIAVTATLLSLAFAGGAAAQQVLTYPVPGAAVPGPGGTVVSAPIGAATGVAVGPVGAVTAPAQVAVAGFPPPAAGTCYVVSRRGVLRRDRAGRPLVARC